MRQGNRKSNIANRAQNGNWLQRFRKDGVLPLGKRKKEKSPPIVEKRHSKKRVPKEQTKSFCNHPENARLSNALTKVQIEGLKIFIVEAKMESKKAIIIPFMPEEKTKKYLEEHRYLIKRLSLRKRGLNKSPKQKVLISW
ncbi:hypothetical protein [Sediminibacterium soli]|uniref:hypothetical protein n=1 Tax=Sediminibacterium soli TaxID=2698829 RepID=UPI00137AB1B8|nr:hypothetical protein [Sediminibacterium soli]NCI47438.1 hypothetical protein [Sediminibacterium soli]